MVKLDLDTIDAVVFDLDDTLIDTSGQLVPAALRVAAEAMVAAGIDADAATLHGHLVERASAGLGADYFGTAVARFGTRDSASGEEIAARGRRAYLTADVGCPPLLPGAVSLLERLRDRARLFLVTAGDPDTQRRKVTRLGIAPRFDEIRWVASVDGEDKFAALAALLDTHALTAERCVVVGDRVGGEIHDANRLGMISVWIRRGEFREREPRNQGEVPGHVVRDVAELTALFGLEPETEGPA